MDMDSRLTDNIGRRPDSPQETLPDRAPQQESKGDRRRALPAAGSSRLEEEAGNSTLEAAADTHNVAVAIRHSEPLPEVDSRLPVAVPLELLQREVGRRIALGEAGRDTPVLEDNALL